LITGLVASSSRFISSKKGVMKVLATIGGITGLLMLLHLPTTAVVFVMASFIVMLVQTVRKKKSSKNDSSVEKLGKRLKELKEEREKLVEAEKEIKKLQKEKTILEKELFEEVPIEKVKKGDIVRLKSGELKEVKEMTWALGKKKLIYSEDREDFDEFEEMKRITIEVENPEKKNRVEEIEKQMAEKRKLLGWEEIIVNTIDPAKEHEVSVLATDGKIKNVINDKNKGRIFFGGGMILKYTDGTEDKFKKYEEDKITLVKRGKLEKIDREIEKIEKELKMRRDDKERTKESKGWKSRIVSFVSKNKAVLSWVGVTIGISLFSLPLGMVVGGIGMWYWLKKGSEKKVAVSKGSTKEPEKKPDPSTKKATKVSEPSKKTTFLGRLIEKFKSSFYHFLRDERGTINPGEFFNRIGNMVIQLVVWIRNKLTGKATSSNGETKGTKTTSSTTGEKGYDEITTNPEKERKQPGGIDFRALPITTQPGINPQLMNSEIAMKTLQTLAAASNIKDLDKEWTLIQKEINGKAMPYAHIKEYIAVCVQRRETQKLQQVAIYLSTILKFEEEFAIPTAPEMQELLVLMEVPTEAATIG
ncbi:MAG: hypothetical protein N2606_01715, partial [Candidatus Omnitrophica bacterium]|nr:hypothetical protein [Candidatus Omnitrophota bacterium]